jgi:LPS-assembly lipoprotein
VKRALAALVLMLTLPLGACGFTPLYAAPGVTPNLAAIDVVAPQGRVGQLLREELDDALGRDKAVPPAYRLDLWYRTDRFGRGLRIDNVVSRYELVLDVEYHLVDTATGKTLRKSRLRSEVTYDSNDQPYASLASLQDAEARAAADAARRIHLELATWFATARG